MEIKNIVFDIGNVLMDFCWRAHLSGLGFTGETFDRVAKATILDDMWNVADQGTLSEDKLLEKFIENDPEMEKEIRLMYSDLSTIVETFSYTIDWIKQLKSSGYKVYALSNFSEKACRECKDKLSFLEEMDGYILSFAVKQIKPDEDIYETLFSRYNLVPEECVFIDDRADNIETGKKLGMKGVVFTSRSDVVKELQKLGVNTW